MTRLYQPAPYSGTWSHAVTCCRIWSAKAPRGPLWSHRSSLWSHVVLHGPLWPLVVQDTPCPSGLVQAKGPAARNSYLSMSQFCALFKFTRISRTSSICNVSIFQFSDVQVFQLLKFQVGQRILTFPNNVFPNVWNMHHTQWFNLYTFQLSTSYKLWMILNATMNHVLRTIDEWWWMHQVRTCLLSSYVRTCQNAISIGLIFLFNRVHPQMKYTWFPRSTTLIILMSRGILGPQNWLLAKKKPLADRNHFKIRPFVGTHTS